MQRAEVGDSLSPWGAVPLTKHAGTVRDIAVSRDARLVASASGDHVIHVCQPALAEAGGDADAGRTVLRGHRHIVSGVSFAPDGCFLVSCSFDKTLRVWARPAAPPQHAGVGGGGAAETVGGNPQWRLQAVIEGHADRCAAMQVCARESAPLLPRRASAWLAVCAWCLKSSCIVRVCGRACVRTCACACVRDACTRVRTHDACLHTHARDGLLSPA